MPSPEFIATDLVSLGSLTSEPGVCGVAIRLGIKSINELFDRQVIVGSTGPNALLEDEPQKHSSDLATFKFAR